MPHKEAPRIEIRVKLLDGQKNAVAVEVKMWINGARITGRGQGATVDEAWDWAANQMQARSSYDREFFNTLIPLADIQWPLL